MTRARLAGTEQAGEDGDDEPHPRSPRPPSRAGKTLALDVRNEYVVFVAGESTPPKRPCLPEERAKWVSGVKADGATKSRWNTVKPYVDMISHHGTYRVFGSNGPIGWTQELLLLAPV